MDKDEITLSHLLANPIHIRRLNQNNYSIDNEIIRLLENKFEVKIEKENYHKIITKIEKMVIELQVEPILNRIIDNIDG